MASLRNLGTTPLSVDTQRILEVKILNALNGGGGAGTGGSGIVGTGSPEGVVSATPGTIYFDSASSAFYVKGSGSASTGWVALIV